MPDQSPLLDWRDDIPVSTRFDDPYYSLDNGLAETRHTFLAGNALPERFHDGFHIAELGFGTGLNLLAALLLWRASGQAGRLIYTTFELYPLSGTEMVRAQARFADLAGIAAELAPYWHKNIRVFTLPDLSFTMINGDARQTVPAWEAQADAWFLDGFAPAKNPELWAPDLMQAVHDHSAERGTLATYTAAGHVRRALAEAGFAVTRQPGYGRKRHMTTARKASAED
ncbi:tRNA (5-methylaminomethyl-2-thiouridine)(34)-methyltransferase MnmD [Sagittula salina]|uniref:tRNA (5-methylaminomethyl-2-thiouridine)(34)-methyltransferase MnmD n=1 Tax=Sagittula salina TaxID=2820268 RepID=A0A940RZX3_9RHOB|nr:tRNA (5-methylaminomethyl-2-thiouridine)(34)-methyltransferase MnmD [Sagittula salina]MBP0481566.1 tRNA (5-methylaminomethyl-2-thiouridine)(34)-methyltransferase MnmD [Sagittula salina]